MSNNYYKIKYSCGCEYEGNLHSASRCPSDHYSEIVEMEINGVKQAIQVQAGVSAENGGQYFTNAVEAINHFFPNSKVVEMLIPEKYKEEVEALLRSKNIWSVKS